MVDLTEYRKSQKPTINVSVQTLEAAGYGPRLVRTMNDGKRFLVGCKDGSLDYIELNYDLISKEKILKENMVVRKRLTFAKEDLDCRITAFAEWSQNVVLGGTKKGHLVLFDIDREKDHLIQKLEEKVLRPHLPLGDFTEKALGAVRHIDWIGPKHLIISFSKAGSFILFRDGAKAKNPAAELIDCLKKACFRQELKNLTCSVWLTRYSDKNKKSNVLFITREGTAFLAKDFTCLDGDSNWITEKVNIWNPGEKPGFIEDFSVIKPPIEGSGLPSDFRMNNEPSHGVFISTDMGIFKVNPQPEIKEVGLDGQDVSGAFEWKNGFYFKGKRKNEIYVEEEKVHCNKALQIFLPNMLSQTMAIGYFSKVEKEPSGAGEKLSHYLWVSGVDGDMHLYTCNHKETVGYHWKQIRALHVSAQTLRCYVSWFPTKLRTAEGFLVVQSRRNDEIAISHYYPISEQESEKELIKTDEDKILAYIKTGEKFEEVETIVKGKNSGVPLGGPVHSHAAFFQYAATHKTAQGNNYLELLLAVPGLLVHEALDSVYVYYREQNLSIEEDELSNYLTEAFCFWVYTLMGLIHTRLKNERYDYFQQLIRWLRFIEEEHLKTPNEKSLLEWPAGVTLENAKSKIVDHDYYWIYDLKFRLCLERLILFVRKWGIYRHSLRTRLGLRQVAGLLDQNDGESYLPDRLASNGLLFSRNFDEEPLPKEFEEIIANYVKNVKYIYCLKPNDVLIVGQCKGDKSVAPVNKKFLWLDEDVDLKCATVGSISGMHLLIGWSNKDGFKAYLFNEKKGWISLDCPKKKEMEYVCLNFFEEKGLNETWLAAGRKGQNGTAKCDIYKVSLKDDYICLILDKPSEKDSRENSSKSEESCSTLELNSLTKELTSPIGSNKIKAMASLNVFLDDSSNVIYCTVLVFGCEDGQVWMVERCNGRWMESCIAKLGNPITSLAMSGSKPNRPRIFAGTENGTIVAIGFKNPGSAQNGPRFSEPAIIWATMEKREIISLQCYLEEGEKEMEPFLLACCRNGRVMLYDDRKEQLPVKEKEHARMKVAGCRRGRLKLDRVIRQGVTFLSSRNGQFERHLLYLDEKDKLGSVAMKYSLDDEERKDVYRKIEKEFIGYLPGGDRSRNGRELYRMTEAIESASQGPVIMLARIIMKFEISANILNKENVFWLPERLIPLSQFSDLYLEKRGSVLDEDAKGIKDMLENTLKPLVNHQNLELYKEVVEGVLKKCNLDVFGRRTHGKDIISYKVYSAIQRAVQSANKNWSYESTEALLRVQMHTVKNMMDGDALYESGLKYKPNESIIDVRVKQVYKFLVQGDNLLALETLRACNFSLWRASQRIIKHTKIRNLPWSPLHYFYRAVGDFAARGVSANSRLGVSLSHEIVRCFALGILVCPEASILWANILWESRLPSTYHDDVLAQLDYLNPEINNDSPLASYESELKISRCLFSFVSTLDKNSLQGCMLLCEVSDQGSLCGNLMALSKKLSGPNKEAIGQMVPFIRLVEYLNELVIKFETHAEDIDLQQLKIILEGLKLDASPCDYYAESRFFWITQLEHSHFANVKMSGKKIRPEVVFYSKQLGDWALKALEQLEGSWTKYQIFEPEYSHWKDLLKKLKEAADRFPQSTAVHQNILLVAFGHGLLENLDEHLFEMEEVAQVLDPVGVWFPDGPIMETTGHVDVIKKLANYLMSRSRFAESIPKNLRTLQSLFHPDTVKGDTSEIRLKELILSSEQVNRIYGDSGNPYKWDISCLSDFHVVESKHVPFLKLAFEELRANDKIYGQRNQIGSSKIKFQNPKVTVSFSENRSTGSQHEHVRTFSIEFPLILMTEKQIERFKEVFSQKESPFQEPVPPNPERALPSHGLGLYLANLAVSMVHWRINVEYANILSLGNHEQRVKFKFILGDKSG